MSLRGFLKLKNEVTITKIISTNDGMGGVSSISYITTLPACALWQNRANNKWTSDKYAKDSSHTLCFEYGNYTFNDIFGLSSNQSIIESVQYNGEDYKVVGFSDNVMNKDKIVMQALDRTK
jgi:hypothetical protein